MTENIGSDRALTAAEDAQLRACENIIGRGLQSFFDVGNALQRVRDGQLFRTRYTTFADYCEQRWKISRPRAYQLMHASAVVSSIVDKNPSLPAVENEAQARELHQVPEAERADAWSETVERTAGKPTAAAVRDVRKQRSQPRPDPHDASKSAPTPTVQLDSNKAGVDVQPDPASMDPTGNAGRPRKPDDFDLEQWRHDFFDSIVRARKLFVVFDDEHLASAMDDQAIDEFGRLIRTLSDKHAHVLDLRASARPSNVRHLKVAGK